MAAVQGWVGCYTSRSGGDPAGGIGRLTTDADGWRVMVVAKVSDPSYLALSPARDRLYAVVEEGEGRVSAFAVRGDGLEPLGGQATGGAHPCHLLVHPNGRYLLTANYSSGSVVVHPILADGSLGPATDHVEHSGHGPDAERQEGPHAHQVLTDRDGEHVHVVDLGIDAVMTYVLSPEGRLRQTARLALPPGTGPRHMAFHPSGHAAYLVGELTSTLTTLRHERGRLTPVTTVSTRAVGAEGPNLPAAVVLSADGKQVFVTNRGDDSVATVQLAGGGLLARVASLAPSGGRWPRDLARAAGGALLAANERSGTITEVGGTAVLDFPAPTCLLLD